MADTDTLEIRQLARQFAESELRPHVEKWDHDGELDPAVISQLSELGFFGMLVSEAHGGMAFDLPTFAAALEEIAWGEPGVAFTVALANIAAHLIEEHGSAAQKQRWLEQIASGEALACLAFSEDEPTRAQRKGDDWEISGVKKWITNARTAKVAVVQTRSAAFIVPTDAPGFKVRERSRTLGFRVLDIADVELRDVTVSADAVITGTKVEGTVAGKLAAAAIAVGIAQAAFEHARHYADVREQFGARLRTFEGVQFKLADMAMRTEAARTLLQKAAADGTDLTASMAKVFASETSMWVTTQAVQVFGGYGYMHDYPVEKLMRDAKALEMMEGLNDVLRGRIARSLYR